MSAEMTAIGASSSRADVAASRWAIPSGAFAGAGGQVVSPEHAAAGRRWYVVHTRPHSEARAIANLEHQAFHVFCPRVPKTVRHARKLSRSMAPLFPDYVFVHLDAARDRWRSINGTRGVVRLISQGDIPAPVPNGVVEALQTRADSHGVISWISSLKLGQTVRISDGPFAGLVGTLESLDEAGRVHVLLQLMGRSVSAAFHGKALVPAE
jgi:Transcription antiterminator